MKTIQQAAGVFALGCFVVMAYFVTPSFVQAQSPSESVIKAASQEGAVIVNAPASLSAPERVEFARSFLKKYGLKIDVQIDPSGGSMVRKIAKVAQEIAVGQPPTWDALIMTDYHHSILFKQKLSQAFDWAGIFGIDKKYIAYKTHSIVFATSFALPAYNTDLVRKEDVPKSWDDVLSPKWKGKIGVNNATHHWARLAQVWGETRAIAYLKKLKALNPQLGSNAEIYTKLQLGEILVAATITDSYMDQARKSGAPLKFAEINPTIAPQYMSGTLKGARHPNAAALFSAFLLSKEGQAVWEKTQGQSSLYTTGTKTWNYIQGRDVIVLDEDFAISKLDSLSEEADKILGFRR
jgi:iron(III) transport system substrate-binding protein